MVVKIVNETGGTVGTKLLIGEDGTDVVPLLAVTGLAVKFELNGVVRAEVELGLVQTEIQTSVTEWVTQHPLTREYQRVSEIKFADGTTLRFDERGDPRIVENPAAIPVGHEIPVVRLADIGTGRERKFKGVGYAEARGDKAPN